MEADDVGPLFDQVSGHRWVCHRRNEKVRPFVDVLEQVFAEYTVCRLTVNGPGVKDNTSPRDDTDLM